MAKHDWGLHLSMENGTLLRGYENNPVIRVTWYGTRNLLLTGCRLPTEVEWNMRAEPELTLILIQAAV